MPAQPPGFHPSALRVATHRQQVASLWGWASYLSAEGGGSINHQWEDSEVQKHGLCHWNRQVVIHPLSWKIEYRSTQCLIIFGMHTRKNFHCGSATNGYYCILRKNLACQRGWFPWRRSYKSTSRRSGQCSTIRSWTTLWRYLLLMQRCACKGSERNAYLQIHIDKTLRPFQTGIIKGKWFCLSWNLSSPK